MFETLNPDPCYFVVTFLRTFREHYIVVVTNTMIQWIWHKSQLSINIFNLSVAFSLPRAQWTTRTLTGNNFNDFADFWEIFIY